MEKLIIDQDKCIKCGLCIKTCPTHVLELQEYPAMVREHCMACLQCLTVCPTAALSIHGVDPADCTPLKNNLPDPEKMKNLIKGRRSVRFYQEKSLPQETLQELMDVVWHAPTGVNEQSVLLTLIDTREAMIALRDEVYARLEEYFAQQGEAEQNPAYLFACVKQWKERRNDVIFRGAPHMLITSAPNTASCGEADCHILLSYFELLAQSMGFGTLWNGMAKTTLNVLLPDLKQKLGIPEDHLFGYAMIFGNPDIRYARTVERGPAKLNRVSKL